MAAWVSERRHRYGHRLRGAIVADDRREWGRDDAAGDQCGESPADEDIGLGDGAGVGGNGTGENQPAYVLRVPGGVRSGHQAPKGMSQQIDPWQAEPTPQRLQVADLVRHVECVVPRRAPK